MKSSNYRFGETINFIYLTFWNDKLMDYKKLNEIKTGKNSKILTFYVHFYITSKTYRRSIVCANF